jgi:hypothetical protein
MESLEAILFGSLEAPEITTSRTRIDRSSFSVARRLSHVSIPEPTADRSNSNADTSGSRIHDEQNSI